MGMEVEAMVVAIVEEAMEAVIVEEVGIMEVVIVEEEEAIHVEIRLGLTELAIHVGSFLCKAPYDEGLVLIHNLITIGGDRLNPTVLHTAVIGVGIDAFASQVDSLSLYKNNLTTGNSVEATELAIVDEVGIMEVFIVEEEEATELAIVEEVGIMEVVIVEEEEATEAVIVQEVGIMKVVIVEEEEATEVAILEEEDMEIMVTTLVAIIMVLMAEVALEEEVMAVVAMEEVVIILREVKEAKAVDTMVVDTMVV